MNRRATSDSKQRSAHGEHKKVILSWKQWRRTDCFESQGGTQRDEYFKMTKLVRYKINEAWSGWGNGLDCNVAWENVFVVLGLFCILSRAYIYQNANHMFKNRCILLFINCPSIKLIKEHYRMIQKNKPLLHITTWIGHINIILG